ncbi:hypothetical protein VPH35_094686 [Triticum aestivum]
MDRRWIHGTLFSREYIEGVKEFMHLVREKFSEDDKILCPGRKCLNHKYQHQAVANMHILTYGMESTYTRWIYHGEDFDLDVIDHPVECMTPRMVTMALTGLKRCLKTYAQQ